MSSKWVTGEKIEVIGKKTVGNLMKAGVGSDPRYNVFENTCHDTQRRVIEAARQNDP